MTKFKNYLCGMALIALGVIITLNSLEITNINLFFNGWWTLFIIIPCLIGLFDKGNKTDDIIGLIIGIVLLLAAQGIIEYAVLGKLALPTILIILGLSIIFKSTFDKKINKKINELKSKEKASAHLPDNHCAFFSGKDLKFANEVFIGASFTAIFGGIECDLRGAVIENDILINATAVFGGVDIIVPSNVKIKVKSSSVFGGVSNNSVFTGDDTSPTIYINASGVFGGVEIK